MAIPDNSCVSTNKKQPFDDYKAFLHEIGRQLTTTNIDDLIFLTSLPDGVTQGIRTSNHLFLALQEECIISDDEDGLKNLAELFEKISKRPLARRVEEFRKSRTSSQKIQQPTEETGAGAAKNSKESSSSKASEGVRKTERLARPHDSKNNLTLLGPASFTKSSNSSALTEENSSKKPFNLKETKKEKEAIPKHVNKSEKTSSPSTNVEKASSPSTNVEKASSPSTNVENGEDPDTPSENLSVHPMQYALPTPVEYPMDTDTTGICLVISNEKFEKGSDLDDREGTEKDVQRIKETFSNFGFMTRVHRDIPVYSNPEKPEKKNILQIITELAEEDHSDYSCVVVFLLSHGCEKGIYGTDGEILDVNKIFYPFKGSETLTGKPKIFFGQFCRGENVEKPSVDGPPVDSFKMFNHPKEIDVYVGYSTLPGKYTLHHYHLHHTVT
eukprot:gene15866-17464_t